MVSTDQYSLLCNQKRHKESHTQRSHESITGCFNISGSNRAINSVSLMHISYVLRGEESPLLHFQTLNIYYFVKREEKEEEEREQKRREESEVKD